MAESIEQQIKRLKAEYEEASSALSRAEGSLESDMARLKEDFNLTSIQAAEKEIQKFTDKKEKVEQELQKELQLIDDLLNGTPDED